MVGNVADAQRALDGHLPYLGEGALRTAYIDYESSVVYKVENYFGKVERNNFEEWEKYNLMAGIVLPDGWHIPAMSFYDIGDDIVVAAEYVTGKVMGECYCVPDMLEPDHDDICIPDDVVRKVWDAGIGDLGYGNVIRNNLGYWIVDLGC